METYYNVILNIINPLLHSAVYWELNLNFSLQHIKTYELTLVNKKIEIFCKTSCNRAGTGNLR